MTAYHVQLATSMLLFLGVLKGQVWLRCSHPLSKVSLELIVKLMSETFMYWCALSLLDVLVCTLSPPKCVGLCFLFSEICRSAVLVCDLYSPRRVGVLFSSPRCVDVWFFSEMCWSGIGLLRGVLSALYIHQDVLMCFFSSRSVDVCFFSEMSWSAISFLRGVLSALYILQDVLVCAFSSVGVRWSTLFP